MAEGQGREQIGGGWQEVKRGGGGGDKYVEGCGYRITDEKAPKREGAEGKCRGESLKDGRRGQRRRRRSQAGTKLGGEIMSDGEERDVTIKSSVCFKYTSEDRHPPLLLLRI